MSHIFISYSRKDKILLDKILLWLAENKFTENEIWYDHYIEAGDNWRDEITDALDESFAVLVIITENLASSQYCAIEWAYALGQGIPIVPLLLEEVGISALPNLLAAKQIVKCIEGIPDSLAERIKRLKSIPPEVLAINSKIYDIIYDTHRRFFILQWLGRGLRSLDDEQRKVVMSYFVRRASQAQETLEQLMLDKAFVLSGKQHRMCWKLVDFLKRLARIQVDYHEYLPEHIAKDFEQEWLPAFNYFDVENWWHRWTKSYFDRDLEDDYNNKTVLVEMTQVFPMFNVMEADVLINNKNVDIQRDKE